MNANAHYGKRRAFRMCLNHPEKYAQSGGLCRPCDRAFQLARRMERELEQEQRDYESRQQRYSEAAAPIRPTTLRTITTRGETFDIVWDGSIR